MMSKYLVDSVVTNRSKPIIQDLKNFTKKFQKCMCIAIEVCNKIDELVSAERVFPV